MDIDRFRVFLECARLKNFSRVADLLHISQPSISVHIRQLEEWCGTKLFERHGKRTELTGAGEFLQKHAQRLLMDLDRARQGARGLAVLEQNRLAVAGGGPLGTYMLPRILGIFKGLHPTVEIVMKFGIAPEMENWLQDDLVELAMFSRGPRSRNLTGEIYASSPMLAVAPPWHPLARKNRVTLEDLSQEPFILREPESAGGELVRTFFADKGLSIKVPMELSNHEAIKVAVAQGMGITVMARGLLLDEIALRRIKVLKVHGLDLTITHWIIYRRGGGLSQSARAFLQFLHDKKAEFLRLLV